MSLLVFSYSDVLAHMVAFRDGERFATKVALVEAAGKFSMLHPCKHSNILINIENTRGTHGEIL